MATNVREFTLGIDQFRKLAENQRRQRTKVVAMQGLRELVAGTRADTGRARGNWQAGETRAPSGFLPGRAAPGFRDDGEITERVDPIKVEGDKVLAMDGDDIIWLHNGVPYIGVLEDKDKMLVGTYESLKTWIRSQR